MKRKGLRNVGIAVILFQLCGYYGGIPIPFSNINFDKVDSANMPFLISTILAENFWLLLGIILLSIYWFINRKPNKAIGTTEPS